MSIRKITLVSCTKAWQARRGPARAEGEVAATGIGRMRANYP